MSSTTTNAPKIKTYSNNTSALTFTIESCDVSIVNALRRIVLSEISIYGIRAFPNSENKVTFTSNTSRLNNEILKQRLTCIPICHLHTIKNFNAEYESYRIQLNASNNTNTIRYVTTEEFKVVKMSESNATQIPTSKVFPPDPISNDYIEFVRLLPGEEVRFHCSLDICNAKTDGAYNVVHTCSYGCTPNAEEQSKKRREIDAAILAEEDGVKKKNLEHNKKDWELLDASRIHLSNSFDFIIESVGIYSNLEILKKACIIMINKCEHLQTQPHSETVEPVYKSNNTFNIHLKNEDYTLGKAIEYFIFYNYYDKSDGILQFCAFKKPHPHSTHSFIQITYKNPVEHAEVVSHIHACVEKCIITFRSLHDRFEEIESS